MLDFTSALYLGLRHPSDSLESWEALTLGQPSALREPPDAQAVALELARLQGCEAGLLLPSTLHLFWDLFAVLGRGEAIILRDAGTYPIARWGTERAQAMGTPVRTFAHYDAASLARMVESAMRERLKPIVVTDGFCPRCGEAAPVGAYAQLALRAGGRLVLDDTQALGILGERRHPAQPYGTGGGGSLRWHDTFGRHIVTCSSLAKGFGVPVAMIAGERGLIERFRQESETRLHCSPPSAAVIHAARAALETNRSRGDALRRWLLHLVIRLRTRLIDAGLTPSGRLPFPVQTFVSARRNAALLHDRLQDAGIQGLLTTTCRALAAGLTLLITARHRVAEIERTGRVIADAAGGTADRLYPTIEDSWAGYALCPARIR